MKITQGRGARRAVIAPAARVAAAVLAAALAAACSAPAKPEAAEPPEPVYAVETAVARRGRIREYLTLSGDVVAASTVDAYADVAGKVARHFVAVGQRVEKDQAIMEIDPSRPGMSFQPSLVKAPIAGTVTALPLEIGATASPAAPAARIARTDALELRVYAPERFVGRIRNGLAAEASLAAWPDESFEAVVRETAPVMDPASRSLELRLSLRRADPRLKAGMFSVVKIVTQDKPSAVTVPAEALVKRFGETFVFVAEEDPAKPGSYRARRRVVEPGILSDGALEIRAGLAAGEELVVRGQTLLEDGSAINLVLRRPAE